MMLSLPRRAVVEAITDWWNTDDRSVCVVAGDFGTGKSHVMKSLADRDAGWWPWLSEDADGTPLVFASLRYHAGKRQLGAVSAEGWVQDLIAQYEAIVPVAAGAVTSSSVARVGTTVAFNDVEHVEFQMSTNPTVLWERFAKQVLAQLARTRPVLLVIDALDEREDGFRGWIVDRIGELPDGIRVIVSSRSEPDLGTLPVTPIDLDRDDLDTDSDLFNYCTKRLSERFDLDVAKQKALATRIVAGSEGKFLYCYWVCDDIVARRVDVDDLDRWTPPEGMARLFNAFTNRVQDDVIAAGIDWDDARIVLATIAIAFGDGIRESTISRVHRLPSDVVDAVVSAASDYLSEATFDDESDTTSIRVGHFSLAEHWLNADKAKRLSHVADVHRRVAIGLRTAEEPFSDAYSVSNIVKHHCDAYAKWRRADCDLDRIPGSDIAELVTDWDWLEARIAGVGVAGEAISDLTMTVKTLENAPEDAAVLDATGSCGHTTRSLLAALRLIGSQLVESAGQPQRVAQQLQHHAVHAGNAESECAARNRLVKQRRPCAVARWSTERYHPALQHIMLGHTEQVYAVAWSPDSRHLATASKDNSVRIWDATTGDELRRLGDHADWVRSVTWSPDGSKLATACDDRIVRTWDAATGRALLELKGHTGWVLSVAWSPDGRHIASTSDDRSVRIWDATDGREIHTLVGHHHDVNSVAWSPDSSRLATASWQSVRVWDASSGATTTLFSGHTDRVLSVAWSPDGRSIASAGEDRTVRIWDAADGTIRKVLSGHTGWVHSVTWAPGSQFVASAGNDRTVRIWDVDTGRVLQTFTGHIDQLRSVAWSADGRRIASAGLDEVVRIWDGESDAGLHLLTGHTGRVVSIPWSPDRRHLATTGNDKSVRIWDAEPGHDLAILRGHTERARSVAWSPDGIHLVSGGNDGTVRIWDAATGDELRQLTGHDGHVRAVTWSPDGSRVATAGSDRTTRIWNPNSWKAISMIDDDDVWDIKWSPDSSKIAAANTDGTGRVWDVASGGPPLGLRGHKAGLCSIEWSPDGRRLATTSDDHTVRTWDAGTGDELCVLTGHSREVRSLSWSPDGRRVATTSWDNTLRVWDLLAGSQRLVVGFADLTAAVVWSGDDLVVSHGNDISRLELCFLDGAEL